MINDVREVLNLLRDFSFKVLITPLIIRVMYGVGILVAAGMVIMMIVNGFRITEGRGILMVVLSPFVFAFYVMVLRVGLEIIMALFHKASGTPIVVATQAGDLTTPTVAIEEPVSETVSPSPAS